MSGRWIAVSVLAVALAGALAIRGSASAQSKSATYLELNGVYAGRALAEGGVPTSSGPPTPLRLQFGTGMSAGFYDYLKQSINGKTAPTSDGALLSPASKGASRRGWKSGTLAELTMPTVDAASNSGVLMLAVVRIASISSTATSASLAPSNALKPWSYHFRLKIDGLESATKSVAKVEAIRLSRSSNGVTTSPLIVTLAESKAGPFMSWFESVVVKGAKGPETKKRGTLEYLGPQQSSGAQETYFSLTLPNIAIIKIERLPAQNNADSVAQVRVIMNVEGATQFGFNTAATK